jgi:glutamate N-acetyltransferase/amino-acid N-acetyltransferase
MASPRLGPQIIPNGGVTSARGFRAGAAEAGIKEGPPRLDVAIVVADGPCVARGVFTQCQVVAAPVVVSRERLAARAGAQGIILNSGNANACTGEQGLADAREMADLAAARFGVDASQMLVASTGVIGVPLPMDRVRSGIQRVRPTIDGGAEAARAILTTDLVPKEFAVHVEIGRQQVTIGGMAKGSGMIHPNMATMLAVVTTDAALEPSFAGQALHRATERSFNQISVDRDTSTNDTLVLLARGAAGLPPIRGDTPESQTFAEALELVCIHLARMVARDGEGATRLIEVVVRGATTEMDAREVARAIVSSNLVKAAIYGCDPNWGRIMAAIGNSGVPIDPGTIDVAVGGHQVAAGGAAVPFDPSQVRDAMAKEEVRIAVALNRGVAEGSAWGCDLTEGYVRINAEYTT